MPQEPGKPIFVMRSIISIERENIFYGSNPVFFQGDDNMVGLSLDGKVFKMAYYRNQATDNQVDTLFEISLDQRNLEDPFASCFLVSIGQHTTKTSNRVSEYQPIEKIVSKMILMLCAAINHNTLRSEWFKLIAFRDWLKRTHEEHQKKHGHKNMEIIEGVDGGMNFITNGGINADIVLVTQALFASID